MEPFLSGSSIVLLALAVFTLIVIIKGFRIVNQAEVMIIERLGKFHKVLQPGVHIIVPLVDTPRAFLSRHGSRKTIDLREQVLDIPSQSVISKDNVALTVDAILYYQIINPKDVSYEIADVTTAMALLTQTTLRSVIGELKLDETLSSRDTINSKLQIVMDGASDRWGVKVTRVELSTVDPPQDIKQAMEKEMRAERDRRAVVLEAEGQKTSQVLRAEGERDAKIAQATGDKTAEIERATGLAKAIELKADAEANAMKTLNTSINESADASSYLLSKDYIKSLEEVGKGGKQTVLMPMEMSKFIENLSHFGKK